MAFYSTDTMRAMRSYCVPTKCLSASLAPGRAAFVCGGEDLKVYKFDYNSGNEIGKLAVNSVRKYYMRSQSKSMQFRCRLRPVNATTLCRTHPATIATCLM